ncbi:hypothetical protein GCM10027429_32290 [Marivirga atlantica]
MIARTISNSLLSEKDKRIYKIANILMLLAIFVVGGTGAYMSTIGGIIPFWICTSEVAVFCLLLYWHTHGRIALARYIFFLFSICMTAVGSLFHGESGGFDFLFFVTALSPVLFFDKRWQYTSLFVLSIIVYLVVKNLYDVVPAIMPIERAAVPYYMNIVISALLVFFGYGLFKRTHLKHEEILKKQNQTIEEQKEELNNAKTQLEDVLKLRTAKIAEQNSAFVRYAFLNAHKVRSPLARLQGLINITAYEDFANDKKRKFYFDQIQKNVAELDDTLKEISIILNTNMEEE